MDENKPGRRWLSFGIRDLLWAMVVVGLLIGWWLNHDRSNVQQAQAERIANLEQLLFQREVESSLLAWLVASLKQDGYTITGSSAFLVTEIERHTAPMAASEPPRFWVKPEAHSD